MKSTARQQGHAKNPLGKNHRSCSGLLCKGFTILYLVPQTTRHLVRMTHLNRGGAAQAGKGLLVPTSGFRAAAIRRGQPAWRTQSPGLMNGSSNSRSSGLTVSAPARSPANLETSPATPSSARFIALDCRAGQSRAPVQRPARASLRCLGRRHRMVVLSEPQQLPF